MAIQPRGVAVLNRTIAEHIEYLQLILQRCYRICAEVIYFILFVESKVAFAFENEVRKLI